MRSGVQNKKSLQSLNNLVQNQTMLSLRELRIPWSCRGLDCLKDKIVRNKYIYHKNCRKYTISGFCLFWFRVGCFYYVRFLFSWRQGFDCFYIFCLVSDWLKKTRSIQILREFCVFLSIFSRLFPVRSDFSFQWRLRSDCSYLFFLVTDWLKKTRSIQIS